jgi:hypothetical protein
MKTFVPIAICLSLVLGTEARVDAYLDPGSGSMLVQLLLGGIAGAAVIMKLGWERFKDIFRSTRVARGEGAPRTSGVERGGGPPREKKTKPNE